MEKHPRKSNRKILSKQIGNYQGSTTGIHSLIESLPKRVGFFNQKLTDVQLKNIITTVKNLCKIKGLEYNVPYDKNSSIS